MSVIGTPVRRREDYRFLTGQGTYTDDINRPGQLYAYILRSPHANARITGIDTSAAASAPGVVAVYTGKDMAADGVGGLPCGWQIHSKDGSPMVEPPHPPLVTDRVRHVGDQVAVVIAETLAQARDAAELIQVDYVEEPAAIDPAAALQSGAPQVHSEAPGNLCYDWHLGDLAAVEAALRQSGAGRQARPHKQPARPQRDGAARRDRRVQPGYGGVHPLYDQPEPACDPPADGRLRIAHPGGQAAGRGARCRRRLRVENIPLRRGGDRHLGRRQAAAADQMDGGSLRELHVGRARPRPCHPCRAGARFRDAKFLALKVSTIANMGGYLSTFAPSIPTYLYGTLLAGTYTTPAIYVETKAVFTHTVPVDAYRGAGRPEATFLLERIVDLAADELGMEPAELRRRNFIAKDAYPYQTPVALQYDSGDYFTTLDLALKAADVQGFETRRREAAGRGKLRGLGLATYIEACGIAPSAVAGALGARAGLYESAEVRVHPTGSVTILTGSHSHGQGHETTFSQLVADGLGIPIESIEIVHGDTDKIPYGMGTYGSRSLAVGGSAIVKAMDKVVAKGRKIAAHLLEAAEADVEFKDGKFTVAGTDRSKTMAEVALTAYVPHNFPHEELEPGLDETAFYDPKNFTFPSGAHIAEVEIDPQTGQVAIVNFTASDDFGRILNPMIVEGQVHGGLAQGIGQALLEACVYDKETGQLLTGSYNDYTMPRAGDLPYFTLSTNVTPCTHNPLGVKGCGEAGAIGAPAAITNALVDALKPLGIRHLDMPATPERLWRLIQQHRSPLAAE